MMHPKLFRRVGLDWVDLEDGAEAPPADSEEEEEEEEEGSEFDSAA